MPTTFDADAFAKRKLILNGKEYLFRPATLRDQAEYLTPVIIPKFMEAEDVDGHNNALSEAIKHFIPEISEEELRDVTLPQLWAIYRYVIDGSPPEETEKNS
jgi:hypothetical protein